MKTQNINEDSALNRADYITFRIRKNFLLKGIIIIFLNISIYFILYLNLNNKNIIKINDIKGREPIIINQMSSHNLKKDLNEEYKDIQEYIYMVINRTLYNPNEVFKKSENPKISIVISVYNGEGYLKEALLSIQNQDFKDIEVIMVDDCSKDNSVNLIKELMVKDPRIKLYQNEENKGALYTKARGVLNSKGKYVMTLDEDDLYVQRDAFSTLYSEAEENNLDILGFVSFTTNIQVNKRKNIYKYLKTDVIYQPSVAKIMYNCDSFNCKRKGGIISHFLFRTEFFINIIKQIDEKYMKVKMNVHDDFLMFFLLSRKAHNFKQLKRIFYLGISRPSKNNTKINFRLKEKMKNSKNVNCLAYINYIEFILIKTNNDIIDKKIASLELNQWFLKHYCRYNKYIRERAINVLELYLRNKYIDKEIKNEILVFFNENNINILAINNTIK